jgi:hypothetical protein
MQTGLISRLMPGISSGCLCRLISRPALGTLRYAKALAEKLQ